MKIFSKLLNIGGDGCVGDLEDLRNAADRIQGREAHKGRNTTLLLAGITLGILFNPMTGPETRRWLKDKIFGEDEEFGYGSGSSGNSS